MLKSAIRIVTAAASVPYRFSLVGYGCMTCIGNSGPLAEPIVEAIEKVSINWDEANLIVAFYFVFSISYREIW